jgi:hypothetical protein
MPKTYSRLLTAFAFLAVLTFSGGARALGDNPYWFDDGYEPGIASGCWKWNWQQHSWYDHCPYYVYPKAYMYSRPFRGAALRVKN